MSESQSIPFKEASGSAPDGGALDREALRIQAAAVAAQQAALFAQEDSLTQRQTALEHQETQLAAHLEGDRQRLLELREQIRVARTELRVERLEFEQQVVETARQNELDTEELADQRQQLHAERRRLIALRKKLRRRLHRHWTTKNESLKERERQDIERESRLEELTRKLEAKENSLGDARLRQNGEIEVERRRLRAAWSEFEVAEARRRESAARERAAVEAQTAQNAQREAATIGAERDLANQRQKWHQERGTLEEEIHGLEARIQNYRAKLLEMAWRSAPMPTALAGAESTEAVAEPDGRTLLSTSGLFERKGLRTLQAVAEGLSEQRLLLAKQWEDLSGTRAVWEEAQAAAEEDLDATAARLRERRESLDAAQEKHRSSAEETAYQRCRLEAARAQLMLRATAFDADRQRLERAFESRQQDLARREEFLQEWGCRWRARLRHLVGRVRGEYALCEQARQRYRVAREEWVGRNVVLDQERRRLAEKAIALEQYRQKYVVQAVNPATAERRLARLRRHWAYLAEAAAHELAKEHLSLAGERQDVEKRHKHLFQLAGELAVREAELAIADAPPGDTSSAGEADARQLHVELELVRADRASQEQQIAALADEVERLACLLIDDDRQEPPTLIRAA